MREGYRAVSINRIVTELGMSKGGFYHYFESKEQLLIELLEYEFDYYMKHFTFNHDSDLPLRAKLDDIFEKYLKLLEDFQIEFSGKKEQITFFLLVVEAVREVPDFMNRLREKYSGVFRYFPRILYQALKRGEIASGLRPVTTAEFIYIAFQGFEQQMVLEPARDFRDMAVDVYNIILHLLYSGNYEPYRRKK